MGTPMESHLTFALETYARRGLNYLDTMADDSGLPYFNVFWTEPACAAHDWPCYADVRSRQLQGASMVRAMTGREPALLSNWREAILAMQDRATGLLMRPATPWSEPLVEMGGHALTLYALVTDFALTGDQRLRTAARAMVRGLQPTWRHNWPKEAPQFAAGFTIQSLMACARHLEDTVALDLAREMADVILKGTVFGADDTFRHGGHMHGNLRTLLGLHDLARFTADTALERRVHAIFRWVNTQKTSFGFLPEAIGRAGDVVSCETCALMDWLGLAVSLANSGHHGYWGEIERMVRNQLAESQVTDVSWLPSTPPRAETPQITSRDVGARMVGGWAGWTSPTHILAARETLNAHWGGGELRDKTRAFQNCCGGSGMHALYIAWANAVTTDGRQVSVNLNIDRDTPDVLVRCAQPWRGVTTVTVKRDSLLRVRLPDFVRPDEVHVRSSRGNTPYTTRDGWLDAGERKGGDSLTLVYPLATRREEITIGNPGRRTWHYAATWKGDTVVRMEPVGDVPATAYSDFDKRDVEVFYGAEGPGPLYRREHMLADLGARAPAQAELHAAAAGVNHWRV